jgi:predicted nucleic acid-binding protein
MITMVVGRDRYKELQHFVRERPDLPMASSTIGFTETVRSVAQYGQYPRLMSQLETVYTEITLIDEIRDLAADLPGNIRTLDALHVASALSIADYLTVLVSYDRRMLEIAHTQGLPVASPGMN